MQKKIIALAVAGLVSGGAFAQSNVTLSGLYDTGYLSSSAEAATGVKTKTTRFGAQSSSATTNFTVAATEDLGGGMKAGVVMVTEPTAGQSNAGGFANSQSFLWLSSSFGEVKLGYFNNIGLEAALAAQPFGTGVGGGYSGSFGRLQGVGDTAIAVTAIGTALAPTGGTRLVRTNNAVQYKSPSMSGFQVGVLMHNKNSDAGVVASDATGETLIGAAYDNGPISVKFVNAKFTSGSATSALGASATGKHNILGANYTMGPVTAMVGLTTSKLDQAGVQTVNATSKNIGLKYTMGNLAFLGNILRDNDKTAPNTDRKLTGLGVDYSMSKRTTAYVRYEAFDTDTTRVGGKTTNTAVGLRHSF
jgi:predicted porin